MRKTRFTPLPRFAKLPNRPLSSHESAAPKGINAMQVSLKSRTARSEAGNEVRVWMETWAGDQFERLTPFEYEKLVAAIMIINHHFPNAILHKHLDDDE